jgi:hypothetical protein
MVFVSVAVVRELLIDTIGAEADATLGTKVVEMLPMASTGSGCE